MEIRIVNKGLWIVRKNHLGCLIKKISDVYGGDEPSWLREHFKEVLEAYPDERIEEAIICYTEMVEQLKYYSKRKL